MEIEEIRSPAKEDDAIETAILQRLLALHPTLVTFDELLREIAAEPEDFSQSDAASRAVHDLIAAGLLHRAEGLLVPSRAALRFDALLGGRSG